MEEESNLSPNIISINSQQLKSALLQALDVCKLSRYDYVLTQMDLPIIQKQLEYVLKRKTENNVRSSEIVAQCVGDFANALVQDSFTQCFANPPRISFNNTVFLFILYCCGVLVRYLILLPLRAILFVASTLFFTFLIILIQFIYPFQSKKKKQLQLVLFQQAAKLICVSYGTIVRQHGDFIKYKPGQIYVANHTTTNDFAVLCALHPFSVIGQKHTGYQGFIQKYLCSPIDGVWFNRTDRKDRSKTAELIKQRVNDQEALCPLLIFPEGVCVNNKFIIQFKRGAFDIGATVCPIAIKYSDSSNCAYFNSKKMNFVQYCVSLWSQWALIVDIWYLPQMQIKQNETPEQFAHRVQLAIAKASNLVPRQWDGYLKYVKVSQKMVQEQKDSYARQLGLIEKLEGDDENSWSFSVTK